LHFFVIAVSKSRKSRYNITKIKRIHAKGCDVMAFNRSKFHSSFAKGTCPELLTIYHAKGDYTSMPRAMHSHDNCVEFLLLTDGYGVHIVGHHRFCTLYNFVRNRKI